MTANTPLTPEQQTIVNGWLNDLITQAQTDVTAGTKITALIFSDDVVRVATINAEANSELATIDADMFEITARATAQVAELQARKLILQQLAVLVVVPPPPPLPIISRFRPGG